MANVILPFSLDRGEEKLTDRGSLVMVDEYAQVIGLPEEVNEEFPSPGSNRGIEPSAYVRTLACHFFEGGRHIEVVRQIKTDRGFHALVDIRQMPGPDGNRGHVATPWAIGFGGWGEAKAGRRFGAATTCWLAAI
jgi:hypothetical protein